MTIEAINQQLFGNDDYTVNDLSTSGFLPITHMDEGMAAPALVNNNTGIIGDAIDQVVNAANLANWNAVRANGMTAAGLALANTQIISDIINERTAINDVLNEYDEAKVRIEDGLL